MWNGSTAHRADPRRADSRRTERIRVEPHGGAAHRAESQRVVSHRAVGDRGRDIATLVGPDGCAPVAALRLAPASDPVGPRHARPDVAPPAGAGNVLTIRSAPGTPAPTSHRLPARATCSPETPGR
jgi:hypothetical protein